MKVKELIDILLTKDPLDNVVIGYCSEGTYDIQRVDVTRDCVFLDGSEY